MNKMNWNLEGYRALVTGGSKGIGRAVVEALCDFGAEVFVVARQEDELLTLADSLNHKGFSCMPVRADVSDAGDRERIIREISSGGNQLDILVNNVGTNIRKRTLDYSEEEYSKIFNTNLNSAFALTVGLYEFLKQSPDASIINISSVAGLAHMRTGIVYGMTKAALIQMTKNLAVEWASEGIRVNAIAPWYIDTPLARQVLKDPAYLNEVLTRTPLNRTGNPSDVANLAVFLCLPAAGYITGQCIAVDGGFTVNLF
jgi:Tropinone reductase 1